MSIFRTETDRISEADLNKFLESERNRLTQAKGNICSPCTDRAVDTTAPFTRSDYPYIHELGNLSGSPWYDILKQKPEDIIPADPFEISRIRGQDHYQLWDSCIGVPACCHRGVFPTTVRELPILRGTNTHWSETMRTALGKAGYISENGTTRISAPWVIDLTTMGDYGWFLAEAVHTWAHYRADYKKFSQAGSIRESRTLGRLQQAMGLLAVSHFYGLPLFIGEEILNTKAYPYFRQYGVNVKITTNFSNPIVSEPWIGNEAPRFDHTLATIVVAIRIEPPPRALHEGNIEYTLEDRWAGFPTLAAIVGWERMDVITHQPLVSYDPDDIDTPSCYGLHPCDLMTPDSFWNFLALGRRSKGLPIVDDQNIPFEDWIKTDGFLTRFKETPPRPCVECLGWQRKSEASLKRPGKFASKYDKETYHNSEMQFLKVVRKAERDYQAKIYGSKPARNRINKERNQLYKIKLSRDRAKHNLKKAIWKVENSKQLTEDQQKLYTPFREEEQKRKELECTPSV